MASKQISASKIYHTKHGWTVTFKDGKIIKTPYHPNPRMAAGYANAQHKGKIIDVKYVK